MGKRRREPVNVDVQLVEIYEDLANEKEEIRLKGALALVSRFAPSSSSETTNGKKGQNGEEEDAAPVKSDSSADLEKVLRRLFRGLCSGRKAARLGFSIALTELLSVTSEVEDIDAHVGKIIALWEAQTAAAGGVVGQEERDHFFGRLFGAEAIIKSSILFKKGVSFDRWIKILDLIFGLAQKKPWLREECGWILFRAVPTLLKLEVDVKYVEAAVKQLNANGLARTPEGVAIWIAARKVYPTATLPKDIWKHNDPLLKSESAQLAKIMKEAEVSETQENKQQPKEQGKGGKPSTGGAWNSKLHFAWDALLMEVVEREENKSEKSKSKQMGFADFWTEIVDNSLFAASSSDERKYWGFLLFCKVLQESPLVIASQIFSKNLLRCMINQATAEDRYLHRLALRAAKAIPQRVTAEPAFAAPAVKGLLGPAGAINFDQITKTKTVEKTLLEADDTALEALMPLFESLITALGATDSKIAVARRQYLADLLLNSTRARNAAAKDSGEPASEVFAKAVLQLFVKFGYFLMGNVSTTTAPEPAIEQATRDTYQNRITSCLTSLISSQDVPSDLPYEVVKMISDREEDGKYGGCVLQLEGSVKTSVKSALKTLKKIHSKCTPGKGDASTYQALQLLYSLTLLQVYNGDGDAVSMLDELKTCYSKISGKDKDDSEVEDESEASDILVEILLSFASKPSQLFRKMGQQVFGAFCAQLTASGMQSLIAVLEAKESIEGQKEMFDEQGEEGEELASDVDMSDAEGEDSDVEVIDASDVEEIDAEADDANDSDSSSDLNNSESEDEDELAAFNAKLAEALGTGNDLESNASDSDADMNDDEMEELDGKLAEFFRARQQTTSNKKKDKKDAKETMINFKNRVLDLLEIYVKRQPSNPLALDLLMPLLQLIRKTTEKQLGDRAVNLIREYSRLCKGDKLPTIESTITADSDSYDNDQESASSSSPFWSLLTSIHTESLKAVSHKNTKNAHTVAASTASLLICKILIASEGAEAVLKVVDVYSETRKRQLLDSKAVCGPAFWTEWSNWCGSVSGGRVLKSEKEKQIREVEEKEEEGEGEKEEVEIQVETVKTKKKDGKKEKPGKGKGKGKKERLGVANR